MTDPEQGPEPPKETQAERGPERRPGFGRGVWIAFAIYGAIGGLLVVFSVGAVLTQPRDDYAGLSAVAGFSVLFLIAAVALLIAGIVLANIRRDSGLGAGLLVGWALGLVLVPMLTTGVCVGLLNVVQ